MSSKRAIRRKQCTGKQRYASELDARAAISTLHRNKGYQGLLTPYRCSFCNGFHFGHAPANVRRKMGY
ncbi:hypothetical protein [Variovorax sp. DAIF25]|uniref:hypothetical protein n=1 Tax=Variovorax sp. DAIF25 TaxID=3080983 RepID=UPI003D6AB9B2